VKLLYFCPASIGGVARNAIEQALALSALGVEVIFLAPRNFEIWKKSTNLDIRKVLVPGPEAGLRSRTVSRLILARSILKNHELLYQEIQNGMYEHVFLATYSEYLAPLWVRKFERLFKSGTIFGANVLDPVRDYVVGPDWWHAFSVRCGYSFLNHAFVYTDIDLSKVSSNPKMKTNLIPHGPYDFPQPFKTRAVMRKELGVPEGVFLFLSFGHLREYKNLLFVLRALADFPDIHLLVAGTEAVAGQLTSAQYQEKAREFGVQDRCHWRIGYIPDRDVSGYFECADALLMTYSEKFHSGSGILYSAASMKKPMVVSAGDSALCDMVEKYSLGVRVRPDSVEEIRRGIQLLRESTPAPDWDRFHAEQTYEKAAEIIIDKMFNKYHEN
jgi:glycosyltransferase involved in cell wall biosynthesis